MSAPLPAIALKQGDMQPCRLCNRGVMHAGGMAFHRVTIERFVIMLPAVRRQHGLELQIGSLARHIGPDEDMARSAPELRTTALICDSCAIEVQLSLFRFAERLAPPAGEGEEEPS